MKKHNILFLTFIFLVLAFSGSSAFFLWASGEYQSLRYIAIHQQKKGGLYGTALHDDMFPYKVALFKTRKPEIAAIGSSRVMQFRENWFSRSFVNFGGSFRNLNEGELLLDHTNDMENVKFIILGVEFWWFRFGPEQSVFREHYPSRPSIEQSILKPYRWLHSGKISLQTFLNVIAGKFMNKTTGWGIQALVSGVGFRKDGSYSYDGDVLRKPSVLFWSLLERTVKGENGYEKHSDFDENKYEQFLSLVKRLQKNSQVILFFPPLASRLFKAINNNDYLYISNLKDRLNKDFSGRFYDFLNPESIQADDCEFVDPQHGGETVYARILNELALRNTQFRDYFKPVPVEEIQTAKSFKSLSLKGKEYPFIIGCPGIALKE